LNILKNREKGIGVQNRSAGSEYSPGFGTRARRKTIRKAFLPPEYFRYGKAQNLIADRMQSDTNAIFAIQIQYQVLPLY
jgi:hypothetical protein